MKKITLLLTAVFVLSAATLYAQTVVQGNNLNEKFQWLQVYAQSGGNYIIEVRANENTKFQKLEYSGRNNITITLRGIGANRTLLDYSFSISRGVTLVLDNNITLKGSKNGSGDMVTVHGTLIMNNGSAITGQQYDAFLSSDRAAGVQVYGTFIMNGGTISDNRKKFGRGGGVWVDGTFTMNGGTISGNYAETGGGGVWVGGGTFTMNGGTISGNTSYIDANGGGGGVWVSGTFTMNGGTISGNTSSGRGGGGVYVDNGTFTMKNGLITGNTIRNGNGGGVCVVDKAGTFIKTGGTITGYASDRANGNVAKDFGGNVRTISGHAVYADGGNSRSVGVRLREGTAGPGDNLSYSDRAASGAWDNAGTSAAPTSAPAPAAQPAPAPAPAPRPQPQQQNQPAPRPQQPTPTPAPAATPTPPPQTTVLVPTQLQGTWATKRALGFLPPGISGNPDETIVMTNNTFRYNSSNGGYNYYFIKGSLVVGRSTVYPDFPSEFTLFYTDDANKVNNSDDIAGLMGTTIFLHKNGQELIWHLNGSPKHFFKK